MNKYELTGTSFIGTVKGLKLRKLVSAVAIAAEIILSSSGCDMSNANSTQPSVEPTISESATPNPTPKPTPSVNSTQTPNPTQTPDSTMSPTPMPTVILSSKDDICRDMDDVAMSDEMLNGHLAIGYLKSSNRNGEIIYLEQPDGKGKDFVVDFFTGKCLFQVVVDSKKDTVTYVPTDVMKEEGNFELVGFDVISAFLTEKKGMSEDDANKTVSSIKTGKDLREWYENAIPKSEWVVIPWENQMGLMSDYNQLKTLLDNTLDAYRENNPETHKSDAMVKELVI